MKLFEAFEALEALNEETFTVSNDGIEKLGTFMSEDENIEDTVDVIDTEAETEEELSDSYIGQVILDCSVCHSKLYKNKSDITLSEDEELANVGEDCPYCYTSEGFKVVGEVAPFNTKVETSQEATDESEASEDESEEVNESLTEAVATLERPMSKMMGTLSNVLEAHQTELASLTCKEDAIQFLNNIEPEVKNKGYLETVKAKILRLPDFKVLTFLYNIILKGDGMGSKLESLNENHRADRHRIMAEIIDILAENGFDTDSEDVEEYAFAARDLVFEEYLADPSKTMTEVVNQWFKDTQINYPEDLANLTKFDENELEEGIFGIKTKKEKEKEAKAKAAKEAQKQRDKELKDQEERARQQSVADSWARSDRAKRDAQREYNRSNSSSQSSKVSNTGKAGVYYSGGDYYSEDLNESVNNVNVETEDTIVNVSTDENGKISVTTEPITNGACDNDETVVPLSDETKEQIVSGEEVADVDQAPEEEVDIEEFDEESFDELGESYLKGLYENVESFKTKSVATDNNNLIVEGVITFDSGNSKLTSFVFEAKDFLKEGTYRFVGKNRELSENLNNFELTGKIVDKKFICEALTTK